MWTSSSRSRESHGNDILSCLKTCLKIVREVQHQNSNWKGSRRKKLGLEEVHGENFPASFLSRTEWQTSQIRGMAGEVCIPKHDAQKHGGVVLELWWMGSCGLCWLGPHFLSWNVGEARAGHTYTKNSWGFNSECIWQVSDVGSHGSISIHRDWRKSSF